MKVALTIIIIYIVMLIILVFVGEITGIHEALTDVNTMSICIYNFAYLVAGGVWVPVLIWAKSKKGETLYE